MSQRTANAVSSDPKVREAYHSRSNNNCPHARVCCRRLSIHSRVNICLTASKHTRWIGGSFLRQAYGRADGRSRPVREPRMTWLRPVELRGSQVSLVPLNHGHANDLVEALYDGELWKLWYTSIPSPDK